MGEPLKVLLYAALSYCPICGQKLSVGPGHRVKHCNTHGLFTAMESAGKVFVDFVPLRSYVAALSTGLPAEPNPLFIDWPKKIDEENRPSAAPSVDLTGDPKADANYWVGPYGYDDLSDEAKRTRIVDDVMNVLGANFELAYDDVPNVTETEEARENAEKVETWTVAPPEEQPHPSSIGKADLTKVVGSDGSTAYVDPSGDVQAVFGLGSKDRESMLKRLGDIRARIRENATKDPDSTVPEKDAE